MSIWNVCLTHHPRYAGLYRAVNDFARACGGPILSFDATASTTSIDHRSGIYALAVKGWSTTGPHWIPRRVQTEAAELLTGADGIVAHSLFRAHCRFVVHWARRTGKPYWVVPHGCLDPWGLGNRRLAKRLWLDIEGQRTFTTARGVFFATGREMAKAEPWIGDARSIVTPWPVEQPDPGQQADRRRTFRDIHHIPSDSRVLLFVGRLHSMKRPRELIDAFRVAALPACHLVIVGMDGDITSDSLERYAGRPEQSRVHVVGPLHGDDLAASMAASDTFVSLSYRENFGYAVADALAAGLPVILSDGHDLAHDLPLCGAGPGSCGWLVTDDSITIAATAMRAFSSAPTPEIAEMGRVAETLARDRFSRRAFHRAVEAEVNGGRTSTCTIPHA